MLEAGNVFPWYADLERRRVEIGDELFETYGVKKDDFKDDFFDITTVLSRIHPDDRGIFDVVYKNLLEGKQHKIGIEIRLDLLNSAASSRNFISRSFSTRQSAGLTRTFGNN